MDNNNGMLGQVLGGLVGAIAWSAWLFFSRNRQ